MGHHPTPVLQRVGAFLLGSIFLALHQAGDRFFNDPDGNAWILQERRGRA